MKNKLTLFISLLFLGVSAANSNATASSYKSSSEGIQSSGYLNSDVFIDLAIVNPGFNTVSVRMGNGVGGFGTAATYSTGSNPQAVTIANLNGDAYADLIVVNTGSNTVSVLMGAMGGLFGTQVTYNTSSSPQSVVATDLDNDGDADLAVVNDGNDTVGILKNNGSGTFVAQVTYAVGAGHGAGGISAGDFNGDGYKDLVVVNNDNSNIGVLLNNGSMSAGTFGSQSTYAVGNTVSTTGGVTVGDINNDTKLDIAVVNSNSNTVSVLNGTGMGTFNSAVSYGVQDSSSGSGICFADFNSDGFIDIAAVNPGNGNISILLNNTNNTFASAMNYTTFVSPKAVEVGDYDGDGFLDLAVASTSSSIKILIGNNDGTFH